MPAWGWAREGGAGHTAAPTASAGGSYVGARSCPRASTGLGGGLFLSPFGSEGLLGAGSNNLDHFPQHPAAPVPTAQRWVWRKKPLLRGHWVGRRHLGTITSPGHGSHTCITFTPCEGAQCALPMLWHGQGGSGGHQPLGIVAPSPRLVCGWNCIPGPQGPLRLSCAGV